MRTEKRDNALKLKIKNKELTCSKVGCSHIAEMLIQHAPICSNCNTARLATKKTKHIEKLQTDSSYKKKTLEYSIAEKNKKKAAKIMALNNSIEIAKLFNPKLKFSISNIREEVIREHIFDSIQEITGLSWRNEQFIAKATNSIRGIDIFMKDLNLIIEFKNTAHTQKAKSFLLEMENHYEAIENSIYKGANLISVSVNGSMCDYNILEFIIQIHDFLLFKSVQKHSNNTSLKIQKLQKLISKLESSNHLFEENKWPELKSDSIIENLLERRVQESSI